MKNIRIFWNPSQQQGAQYRVNITQNGSLVHSNTASENEVRMALNSGDQIGVSVVVTGGFLADSPEATFSFEVPTIGGTYNPVDGLAFEVLPD